MPLLLGVNIDHVATLRQARYALAPDSPNAEPNPLDAGHDALAGGADSLTIHVRGDRRHMQDADAIRIRAEVPLPLNLEMGVTEEMIQQFVPSEEQAAKWEKDRDRFIDLTYSPLLREGDLPVATPFPRDAK